MLRLPSIIAASTTNTLVVGNAPEDGVETFGGSGGNIVASNV